MSARENNPCSGRYDGCSGDPPEDRRMCDGCREKHNALEAARRAERKAAGKCVVCGGAAVKLDGTRLSTCKTHREYFRARAVAKGES